MNPKHDPELSARAAAIFFALDPEGELRARGRRYRYFASGTGEARRYKFRADEIGGSDYIGFNLYALDEGPRITTCELDWHDVIDFMLEARAQ